ncbi:MAG: folylpolyglutamate synthase/dihydrofolate synthase family protein [Thermodesulfobacteriota bacterium]
MDYQEAWAYLDQLQFFKIKLGLDSMTTFLGRVGHPQRQLQCIHVAGTNGKGSVSSALLAVLSRAGYRVGLYTSPHLSSVRERFRINDTFIPEQDFARVASQIREVLGDEQITYFEFTTALALLWFAQEQVDLAILEVGMGGRLDATNVVTPLVGVITNVTMDHEAYLGDTLEAVAREKAGIVKPGVPLVSAVADDISRVVVETTCAEKGAPLFLLGRDFAMQTGSAAGWEYQGIGDNRRLAGLRCNLIGQHQADNMAVVLAICDLLHDRYPVPETAIREGLAAVRWPGRLESFQVQRDGDERRFLLDGAHNPAGVASLVAALRDDFTYRKLLVVWGSMADKDLAATLAQVAPLADTLILTRPAGERSATAAQLFGQVPEADRDKVVQTADVQEALDRAWTLAGPEDLICIAGSLYLVGAVRQELLGEVAA